MLVVVYFVTDHCFACFCCARFSFSVLSQEIGWEERNVSEMTYSVSGGTQNLNSVSQAVSVMPVVFCRGRAGGAAASDDNPLRPLRSSSVQRRTLRSETVGRGRRQDQFTR